MRFPRSCGTLVHPTSFPGKYGIGDFGYEARKFLDFLEDTQQSIWQVLPLTPTGYGNSPYASYSAFAGNPYLISPDILFEKGLLTASEARSLIIPSTTTVAYQQAVEKKSMALKLASSSFYETLVGDEEEKFEQFKLEHAHWLDDYVLFMAIAKSHQMRPWNSWDSDISTHKKAAINNAKKNYAQEIKLEYWLQYEFLNQWIALKEYANTRGVRIIGDIPIFVDHNSADVWANSKYFAVDKQGNRTLVSGVPPDYFSETGQLWGNPQYEWGALEKDGYSWWVKRFKHMFLTCDAIRVDHFRGFDAYWEIPASEKTAVNGRWVKGPGEKFFDTILKECGELPIIAEDLGFVTEGVEKLRDKYAFPGMKILQFAFDAESDNSFLPHNYPQNCVVYSGTHDNDTSKGWYEQAPEYERHFARTYSQSDGTHINWAFIQLGMLSVGDQAIFPLQDFMDLSTEHRMNFPGTSSGNWLWRYTTEMLQEIDRNKICSLIHLSNRYDRNK